MIERLRELQVSLPRWQLAEAVLVVLTAPVTPVPVQPGKQPADAISVRAHERHELIRSLLVIVTLVEPTDGIENQVADLDRALRAQMLVYPQPQLSITCVFLAVRFGKKYLAALIQRLPHVIVDEPNPVLLACIELPLGSIAAQRSPLLTTLDIIFLRRVPFVDKVHPVESARFKQRAGGTRVIPRLRILDSAGQLGQFPMHPRQVRVVRFFGFVLTVLSSLVSRLVEAVAGEVVFPTTQGNRGVLDTPLRQPLPERPREAQ